MSPKAPWIICHDGSGPKPFGLECERCGCFEKVKQPILVDGFLDKCREFSKVHKNCREQAKLINRYVVGLAFSKNPAGFTGSVLLVQKERPAWQKGFWNGIGGKIEPGETTLQAMLREAGDEASLGELDWICHGVMRGINTDGSGFECFIFAAANGAEKFKQNEDEFMRLVTLDVVFTYPLIDNLRFLIPFCLREDGCTYAILNYGEAPK